MLDTKHKNYEILNLIGYGLAKFNDPFVKEFGFKTKTEFYEYVIRCGVAETIGTVKNRQDLFENLKVIEDFLSMVLEHFTWKSILFNLY